MILKKKKKKINKIKDFKDKICHKNHQNNSSVIVGDFNMTKQLT